MVGREVVVFEVRVGCIIIFGRFEEIVVNFCRVIVLLIVNFGRYL